MMVKMPSNLRSGRGAVMEAEMRVRTLWTSVNAWPLSISYIVRGIPRLAQANVGNAIVVAERDVEVAVRIEGAAIEADVLVESLEEKGLLVD